MKGTGMYFTVDSVFIIVVVASCCFHLGLMDHTFINEFAVHIKGGHHIANRVAREAGLVNRGQHSILSTFVYLRAPRVQSSTMGGGGCGHYEWERVSRRPGGKCKFVNERNSVLEGGAAMEYLPK
ncbi:hypothetical protein RRG08_063987 [Elysia crispata]|uniref:Uncharacterized protein n=1 Tax=Elysia crispata TaxID=231223 RepID=A0AAE0YEK8_9GAST|nr:hypothetical protein RRG08_063987 [Elysia crispata]